MAQIVRGGIYIDMGTKLVLFENIFNTVNGKFASISVDEYMVSGRI